MMRPRVQRLPNGRRFEFFVAGRGDPTLVIHPGGPGLSAQYLSNLLTLARPGRRVVLLHPRGVGRSFQPRTPGEYNLKAMADDVESLREHLGGGAIDLLGFSAGGFVALEYALRHSRGLRALLLCGTAASAADLRAANRRIVSGATSAQRRALRQLERARRFSSPEYLRLIEEIERPYQSRYLRRPSADLAASRLNPKVYRAMMTRSGNEFVVDGTLAHWDARPHLRRIRVPTLVLVGRGDFLYPASRKIATGIHGSRFVALARSSHLANLERPRAYLAEVDRFLRGVGRGAARQPPPLPRPGRVRGRARRVGRSSHRGRS